jgi:hypothetical protein
MNAMKKEIRREIKELRAKACKIMKDSAKAASELQKNRRELDRMQAALFSGSGKQVARVMKRVAILEGRLA